MERKGIPVTAPRIEEWELGKGFKITGSITLLHIKTFTNATVILLILYCYTNYCGFTVEGQSLGNLTKWKLKYSQAQESQVDNYCKETLEKERL